MSASALGARQRDGVVKRARRGASSPAHSSQLISPGPGVHGDKAAGYSFVDLGDSSRVSLMLTPHGRGSLAEQAAEILSSLDATLHEQPHVMRVTSQTVFLREPEQRPECERLMAAHFGEQPPVTNYVLQPPCCGAALALEAWAIGGKGVRVERFSPHTTAISYDSVRWVHCGGIGPRRASGPVYPRATAMLAQLKTELERAGSSLEEVVRTWFYVGGITALEGDNQRYYELNRARTDFYRSVYFGRTLLAPGGGGIYPASTGIGMSGTGLLGGCVALRTPREDAVLVHLENPHQTPAYAYHSKYSPLSPKFSRALALVLGHYVTTWISGTASIVNAESRYPGDIRKQTEQTIDNIERLISAENFALHRLPGGGAELHDLAKIRVYLKRQEDFARCKAICERRFGSVPAIYAVADICRPELLVEIEGVAFSRYTASVKG